MIRYKFQLNVSSNYYSNEGVNSEYFYLQTHNPQQNSTAGADFDNMPIGVVFPAGSEEISVDLTDFIIIDDLVNEATEGFVMVLETNGTANEFIESRDALRFDIFDNDGERNTSASLISLILNF